MCLILLNLCVAFRSPGLKSIRTIETYRTLCADMAIPFVDLSKVRAVATHVCIMCHGNLRTICLWHQVVKLRENLCVCAGGKVHDVGADGIHFPASAGPVIARAVAEAVIACDCGPAQLHAVHDPNEASTSSGLVSAPIALALVVSISCASLIGVVVRRLMSGKGSLVDFHRGHS